MIRKKKPSFFRACYQLLFLFVLRILRKTRVDILRLYLGPKSFSVHPSASVALRSIIRLTDGGAISIGARTIVHSYALIDSCGGYVDIKADCSLNPFAVIYGHGGVQIGPRTRIATHSVIVSANHVINKNIPLLFSGIKSVGITIGSDVWIGAAAKILDGISVGDSAVIGAGAVVTKRVPAGSLAIGVPAKITPIKYS